MSPDDETKHDKILTIQTATSEDARQYESDEMKLRRLFHVLSHEYPVFDDPSGPFQPPMARTPSRLHQFAFERLLRTQETLKTQYCVSPSDEQVLRLCPWEAVDANDAKIWTRFLATQPPASRLKAVETRVGSLTDLGKNCVVHL
ncbi:unnamed protein product [Aphanomyces euteiches]